jgi:murein DD-endopeptidase MepM/ murein hydrolase activator NlpD
MFLIAVTTTVVLITPGGFGFFPDNWVTEYFQQSLQENIPVSMQADFNDFLTLIELVLPLDQTSPATTLNSPIFPLEIPIPADYRNTVDFTERFGVPQGKEVIQHGSDFINSSGTPVIAAHAGTVVFAGDDQEAELGPKPDFYGLTVVIEHSIPGRGTVYTLYGQLSEIAVETGDTITAGFEIGLVGNSGNSSGSELHFEVRGGENIYAAARNPELWLVPPKHKGHPPGGGLAGRIVTPQGDPIPIQGHIVLHSITHPEQRKIDLQTYVDSVLWNQPPWNETFGVGDLPPGEYSLSFYLDKNHKHTVLIQPGKLTQWELVYSPGE